MDVHKIVSRGTRAVKGSVNTPLLEETEVGRSSRNLVRQNKTCGITDFSQQKRCAALVCDKRASSESKVDSDKTNESRHFSGVQ
jgi:hypothetical protein